MLMRVHAALILRSTSVFGSKKALALKKVNDFPVSLLLVLKLKYKMASQINPAKSSRPT
jgi:hypothetical protein